MEISYPELSDVGKLAHVYNQQIMGVPHCYPVSPEEFERGFPYKKCTYNNYREDIHSEKIILGEQDGKAVGFADVAIAEVEESGKKERKGYIRCLMHLPGYRPVGQALLRESEAYLNGFGIKEIRAYRLNFTYDQGGYRFYHINYGTISDRLGHICSLFHVNGYEKSGGEMFMNHPDYAVKEPESPDNAVEIGIQIGPPENAILPGVYVRAYRNGKEIGVCETTSVGEFCQSSAAQEWLFVEGLFVDREEQGKGLGRYLLQRNLWEMRKLGYKNAVISTDIANYRAQLLYMNYGFQLADTCYEFVKNTEGIEP
jgi:GNAT superfamily N-acetyltransferase